MKYIVNDDGVVEKELDDNSVYTELKEGDCILRRGTIEYLEGTIPIKFKFIKLNVDACKELSDYGNNILLLIKYIDYATGMLKFSNGRLVRPKHLASILRRKRRSGAQIINELIQKDILHKHKDGKTYYYTMNPYIVIRSKRITKKLYDEFKETKYRNIELEY